MRRQSPTYRVLGHAGLVALSFVFVMPFAWLITTSIRPNADQFRVPSPLVPAPESVDRAVRERTGVDLCYQPTVRHYVEGTTRVPVPLFFRNTLLVCFLTVTGTILASSLVAYGFSVLQWRGREAIFFAMLATMMLPGHVTMIPVFTIWRKLGLINTIAPLVIPAWLGTPFYIFLFRQFFLTVPRELIDAARVDGAGELKIWSRVVMPLSIPAAATVGLFSFLASWNDFLGPLIYLADQDKYTLSLGLAMFRTQYGSEFGQMMAVAALMVVPIVILFFFTQKTFIQGIKTTGMKG